MRCWGHVGRIKRRTDGQTDSAVHLWLESGTGLQQPSLLCWASGYRVNLPELPNPNPNPNLISILFLSYLYPISIPNPSPNPNPVPSPTVSLALSCSSVSGLIKQVPQTKPFKQTKLIFSVAGAGWPGSWCQQAGPSCGHSLACGGHPLPMSSQGCPSVCLCPPVFEGHRSQGSGLILRSSHSLNRLHIRLHPEGWGLGRHIRILGGHDSAHDTPREVGRWSLETLSCGKPPPAARARLVGAQDALQSCR